MPSTPTSKSQVQAYRFVIRRMQSALVRKDAVMLHDPMRTHTRSTVVGAIVGVLGLAGFLLVSILSPANPKPDKGILISAQSGRVYVYAGKDGSARLIPTTNLASARLLYAAIRGNGKGGGASGKGPVAPQTVDDSSLGELADVRMGRLTGIPDGPDIIPTSDAQRAKGMWGICDNIPRQANLNDPTATGEITTTALTGVDKLGTPLKPGTALLVRAPDDQEYLIYRTPHRINIDPNSSLADSDAVRAKVNESNAALAQAFEMSTARPRPISTGLLNAIPQVHDLAIPDIPNAGAPDSFGLGVPVGHVFQVTNSDGSHDYYLMLPHGIEKVNESFAQLVLAKYRTSTGSLPDRQIARIASIPKKDRYDFDQFPDRVPQILTATTAPTVCLGWSADTSDPKFPKVHTEITTSTGLPLPSAKDQPVPISTPNPGGEKIDSFWMPPGTAAVVRSAASADQFDTGPISVITGRGVRYGVPNMRIAKIVGLSHPRPAPESIVHLLPSGTQLDMEHAQKTYDSLTVPSTVGSYESAARRAARKSGNGAATRSGGK